MNQPLGSRADDLLRVRFPEHDFDGYWMMGGIKGDGPFQAIVVGLSLGVNDGHDWGFRDVIPDTDFSLVVARLIGEEEATTYAEQPIHRHQFRYDHERLDVRLADHVRLAVDWPAFTCRVASPDGRFSVDLAGELALSHWAPDMVLRGTSWTTVAFPNLKFSGSVSVGGMRQAVAGIATLDHPMGRLFKSQTSAGMGHWEYNALMIEEEFGLYQWQIVDSNGDVLMSEIVTDYPDGKYHVGDLTLRYEEFEDRGTVHVPRRWHSTVEADHGTFTYDVAAVGQAWDGVEHRRGDPLPNFLLDLDGSFTPNGGSPQAIRGRGTGESVISERDPYSGMKQDPW